MIPKKYHALAFVSILVMLLLLGLHLLGFGLLGSHASSSAAARTAALAANSTSSSSSLLSPSGASSNSVYRHPIVYDKLTGATNNQISEVLGQTKPQSDQFPVDHYQRPPQNPFEFGAAQDIDAFANLPGRPAFVPGSPHQLGPSRPAMIPPPPLPHHSQLVPSHGHPPQMPLHHHTHHPHSHLAAAQRNMLTTPAPAQTQAQQDSLPSASIVANNGAARPLNATDQQQQQLQQQPHPVYYTPPMFTYTNNQSPYEHNQQQPVGPYQGQLPPVGVPEVPFSVDEYNARHARLQQQQLQQQKQQQHHRHQPLSQEAQKQQVNLLADPQAQLRHKQQMLDRQFILGAGSTDYSEHPQYFSGPVPLQDDGLQSNTNNFSTATYYPDPALYNRMLTPHQQQQQQPPSQQMLQRAPYAHPMSNQLVATQLEPPTAQLMNQQVKKLGPQNHVATHSSPPQRPQSQQSAPAPRQSGGHQSMAPPLASSSIVRAQQPTAQLLSRQSQVGESMPTCARQQQSPGQSIPLELVNTTSQMPVLFCNEDPEYPTTEIMRALENFAADRSIEQILPQQLVQMLVQTASSTNNNQRLAELQRQLSLDSLQAKINAQNSASAALTGDKMTGDEQLSNNLFPSSNYEPMCKAATWMAQPRRAKNLLGQWKVVVNLPGHKYRGIAISQMVRIEECTRPNSECALPTTQTSVISSTASPASSASLTKAQAPRSRCLQQYENQRLLAWSHQQGLHFDIFRSPSACSCHNRRF